MSKAGDQNLKLRVNMVHKLMPDIVCVIFLLVYAFIQYDCLSNPERENSLISARVQDVMIIIISRYFRSEMKSSVKTE